jgi:glycosyltransferase involved in cell wall biosynthesis
VSAVSAGRRTVAPRLAPEVVLARPAVGGVAYVGRSVAAALRSRGHTVAELELDDTGAPALRALSEAWRLRGALRRARTVHVELGSTGLGAFWFALFATLLRRDVVLILHDAPDLASRPGAGLIATGTRWRDVLAYRFLAPLLDGALTRHLRQRTGAHVVLSETARLASLAAGSSQVHRVDLGADSPTPGRPSPSAGDCVLFAGFLGPGKGLDTLCEAWSLVSRTTTLPLRIAGMVGPSHEVWAGELRARFAATARPPEWLGWLEEEEFSAAIAGSAIVVLPYARSNPASGVLVRAMIEGRAVVATRVPATRCVAHCRTGLLVPPDDPRALSDALGSLIADRALRDHLGRGAASWAAEQHSWAHHVDGLARAYGWTAEETR